VDVALGGDEPDGNSFSGKISANGRYVVFGSAATDLVAGDTNGKPDVFRRDLRNKKITRISAGYKGTAGSGGASGIYVSISANGNRIAFDSDATDLVPHDTNGTQDIFVRTVSTGVTKRVSVSSSGKQSEPEPANPTSRYLKTRDSSEPVISADGSTVAFSSFASNLVKGDTNQSEDVFTHNLATGKTKRVSVRANGSQSKSGDKYGQGASEPSISANGKVVSFYSVYTNLLANSLNHPSDVYVHHVTTGKNELAEVTVSGGSGGRGAADAILSPSGKSVAFYTPDENVVAGDPGSGWVLRNLVTGKAHRIGTDPSGKPYNLPVAITAVANDKTVLFQSASSNVVANDTNNKADAFVATF
jgi:Tol biopolymer transport system component